MLVLIFCLYAVFGIVHRAISPLVSPIISDLGLTYAEMGIIMGSWQIIYIPVALVTGILIDRLGIRPTLFFGAVMIGLSAVLRYFPDGFVSMLAAVALFGTGGPMISIGGPKIIASWFTGRQRGTAMGIFITGNTCGGMLALTATNSLVMPLAGGSWRTAFLWYGLLAFAAALVFLVFAKETAHMSPDRETGPGILKGATAVLASGNARIIMVMGLCAFAVGHGFGSWLPKILESGGLSPELAGYAASVPLIMSIPAVLILPRAVPERFRYGFIAVSAITTAAIMALVTFSSGPLLILELLALGAASSCILPMLLLLLMDSPGIPADQMGTAGGVFYCVAEIGGVLGPAVLGMLTDPGGSFLAGTLFLSALGLSICIMAIILSLRARPGAVRCKGPASAG